MKTSGVLTLFLSLWGFLQIDYVKGTRTLASYINQGPNPSQLNQARSTCSNGTLLNDHCFWKPDELLNFQDALAYCHSENGTLFAPANQDAQNLIFENFGNGSFWIGIQEDTFSNRK